MHVICTKIGLQRNVILSLHRAHQTSQLAANTHIALCTQQVVIQHVISYTPQACLRFTVAAGHASTGLCEQPMCLARGLSSWCTMAQVMKYKLATPMTGLDVGLKREWLIGQQLNTITGQDGELHGVHLPTVWSGLSACTRNMSLLCLCLSWSAVLACSQQSMCSQL